MNMEALHNLLMDQPLIVLFALIAGGLLLGGVKLKGIGFGSSGVLFTALLAGHLGYSIPSGIGKLGLVLFVYCVGIGAGDRFFASLAREGAALAKLAMLIVALGAATAWAGAVLLDIPAGLATGIFAGALTSTPALAAATEAMTMSAKGGADAVSIGYGIAYPFGVVGVVLFVQVLPRILGIDLDSASGKADAMHGDRKGNVSAETTKPNPAGQRGSAIDLPCLLSLSVGLTLGVLLGTLPFGLPGGTPITLGLAGGPLLVALILGHFGKVGPIVGSIPRPTRMLLQELGLVFFLASAGVRGGGALADTLREHGPLLFVLGICISCLPLAAAWPIATRLLKMNPLQALGGICGGMTSTPALGAITATTDSQTPVVSYASAYPVALVFMIIISKLLIKLIG